MLKKKVSQTMTKRKSNHQPLTPSKLKEINQKTRMTRKKKLKNLKLNSELKKNKKK